MLPLFLFELGPAIQQADTLLFEPCRTLLSHAAPSEPCRTLIVNLNSACEKADRLLKQKRTDSQ
jgi:hypothetical protein